MLRLRAAVSLFACPFPRVLCKWQPIKRGPGAGTLICIHRLVTLARSSSADAGWPAPRRRKTCLFAFCTIIYESPCNTSRRRYEFGDEEREVAMPPFDLHIILKPASPSLGPASASPLFLPFQLFSIFPHIKRPKRKFLPSVRSTVNIHFCNVPTQSLCHLLKHNFS